MQKGQEQFFDYIMERVQKEKEQDAKDLLMENFKLQTKGRFSREDAEAFSNGIEKLLKPERKDEVLSVMAQFSETL